MNPTMKSRNRKGLTEGRHFRMFKWIPCSFETKCKGLLGRESGETSGGVGVGLRRSTLRKHRKAKEGPAGVILSTG